jgi:hypothetical protein
MKVVTLLLFLIPASLLAQTEADKKFVPVEKQFFETCKTQFSFVENIYSSKYAPEKNAFIPSTMELFIVVKDNVKNRYDMINYMKQRRLDLNEITGRYTTLYAKNYESQLQILLYVLTPNCLSFSIL